MKKLIFVLAATFLALLVFRSAAQTRSAWNTLYVTNASTTVPTNFTAGVSATTNIFATRVTIIGKPSARGANASTCYVGPTSADGAQAYAVQAGGEVTIIASDPNKAFNLKDWFVDVGAANDGLTIIYQ